MRAGCIVGLTGAVLFAVTPAQADRPESFHQRVQALIRYSEPIILIENVRLIDGAGAPAIENAALRIEGDRIAAIGEAGELAHPDAVVIDAKGRTLLPGLVMFHEHLLYPDRTAELPAYSSESRHMPPLYLAAGATTIRTGGSLDADHDLRVRDLIEKGEWPGPDIHVTAPFFDGPGSFAYQMGVVESERDARHYVRYWVERGASSFKAYTNISRKVLAAAIDEAHERGATVTGHLCSVTFAEAARMDIDNLEHGLVVASDLAPDKKPDACPQFPLAHRVAAMEVTSPEVEALIEELVKRQVAITSTLPVFAAGIHPAIPTRDALALLSPRSRDAMQAELIRRLSESGSEATALRRAWLEREMAFERAFVAAGGTLVVGTDPTGWGGTIPPNSTHAALILLVEAGFSPLEAIALATSGGARFLGVDADRGRLAPGMRADLVLVDGKPDQDIQAIQNVHLVFRDGVGYDPEALIESVRGKLGR